MSDFQTAVNIYLGLDKSDPLKAIAGETIRSVLAALKVNADAQVILTTRNLVEASTPPVPQE